MAEMIANLAHCFFAWGDEKQTVCKQCYRMLQTHLAKNYLLISFLPIVIE